MNSQNILALANKYSAHTGLALATISTYATGSGDFFKRLQAGHDVTLRRAIRIIQWFSDHYPADLTWPIEIQRPDPNPDSPAAKAIASAMPDPNDPLYKLDGRGRIATPDKFVAAINGVTRASYDQVIRKYADGKPRAHMKPRPHTSAHHILCALVRAGDTRFQSRIDHERLARQVGLR